MQGGGRGREGITRKETEDHTKQWFLAMFSRHPFLPALPPFCHALTL
jgi:hypothetical protein